MNQAVRGDGVGTQRRRAVERVALGVEQSAQAAQRLFEESLGSR
jgi:hypothetical protein